MHAAVLHLHLQSFWTDIPRLGLSLFCFWGSFTKRDLFSFCFFQSTFYVKGTKVVTTIHDHYTELSYCMVKSVAEPKRDLYIGSLGENEVYVVCWITAKSKSILYFIDWLID